MNIVKNVGKTEPTHEKRAKLNIFEQYELPKGEKLGDERNSVRILRKKDGALRLIQIKVFQFFPSTLSFHQ